MGSESGIVIRSGGDDLNTRWAGSLPPHRFFPHENRPPRHEEPRFLEDDPSSTKNGSWESREGCYIIVVNVNRLLAKKRAPRRGGCEARLGPRIQTQTNFVHFFGDSKE